MDVAEFDRFAEEYLATHSQHIRLGEAPDYYARYKIDELGRRWAASKYPEPESILDFGAGIGNSWPFLAKRFPRATISGLDVSEKSLAVAERRFPGLARAIIYEGGTIPLPDQSFDLIFSACVFHHIDQNEHIALFSDLKRLLKHGGWIVIFEHNPLNPLTRHIVESCPFDENAVLIPAVELKRRQMAAGLKNIYIRYTGFFPGQFAFLRPLERYMASIPMGAQYYTMSHG